MRFVVSLALSPNGTKLVAFAADDYATQKIGTVFTVNSKNGMLITKQVAVLTVGVYESFEIMRKGVMFVDDLHVVAAVN